MKNIIIFASGNGTNAQNIINYFRNSDIYISKIICNYSEAKVLDIAKNENIDFSIISKDDLDNDNFINQLEQLRPDLIVLAGFLLKIPKVLTDKFKIINIHPSLLPKFGGKGMWGMNVHKKVFEVRKEFTNCDKRNTMILSYDIIKRNLETYNKSVEQIPLVSNYVKGISSMNMMVQSGLSEFCSFVMYVVNSDYETIKYWSFRDLKELIVNNTKSERLKKLISNKTKPKFDKIFGDPIVLDRLLNGSWKTKPKMNMRGRMSYGTRNSERCEGFTKCVIPIINYVIINGIDINLSEVNKYHGEFNNVIKWFTNELTISNYEHLTESSNKTNELFSRISQFIDSQEDIDYRSVNINELNDMLFKKLKDLILVKKGTMLRSKNDINSRITGSRLLTAGKLYECVDSVITTSGEIDVVIIDDNGNSRKVSYSNFDDISRRRDNILKDLLD